MFSSSMFTTEHFDKGLVVAVGNRLQNGEYTDAILAGTRYLTDVLRSLGDVEGDGAQLVGQVLGGNPPVHRINPLQSISERDEQKGIEQLLRGLYVGVRNPRTHETARDTEDYCVRVLVIIDTMLQYLKRPVEEFDVSVFVNRIYDPYFVASEEYAQSLMAQIPTNRLIDVFLNAFERRDDSDIKVIKYAFDALYQLMPEGQVGQAISKVGDALRAETDRLKIAVLFQLLKPSAWNMLQADVRIRTENLIVSECKQGTFDVSSGLKKGALGTWAAVFGRYFQNSGKNSLAQVLIARLSNDWYSQNYVGQYFMYSLPAIIIEDELIEQVTQALTYAAMSNKARVVRKNLVIVCQNYPTKWKELLKVSVQERKEYDNEYAVKLLESLSQ